MRKHTLKFTIYVEVAHHRDSLDRVFAPPSYNESMALEDCFYPSLQEALSDIVDTTLEHGTDVQVTVVACEPHEMVTEILQAFPKAQATDGILTEKEATS